MTASRRHLLRLGLGAVGFGVMLVLLFGGVLSPVSSADLLGGPGMADHGNLVAYRSSTAARHPAASDPGRSGSAATAASPPASPAANTSAGPGTGLTSDPTSTAAHASTSGR